MSKKEVLTFVFLLCLVVSCFVFGATHDPWDGTKWDVTSPDIDQPHGNDYKEIYDLRKGIAVRMNKEHETLATSSAGGVHKQGSARAFFQDAAPTTQVDGSAFDSGDLGLLWFDSNAAIDNQFHVLTATTPTWTPVSTEIIAFLLASNRTFAGTLTVTGLLTANSGVTLGAGDDLIGSSTSDITFNTNKFTVAGATGNTVIAGTLTQQGVATLADTSALATSGAPAADAQIANKKYVDDTPHTGGVVQVVNTQTGGYIDCTTNFPCDDTVPQNTEGNEVMTLAITPTSATNKLKIYVCIQYLSDDADMIVGTGLFQDSTASALATGVGGQSNYAAFGNISFTHYMTAGTTSETTFKVRAGGHNGDIGFNGYGGSRKFGGVMASSITIMEIKV